MIQSKQDLRDYLAADKLALGRAGARPFFTDLIWRYEILMRQCEYWQNCRKDALGRIVGLWYRWRHFRLGVRCGYSIPLNCCGRGLSLAHLGPVVVNGGAKIGEYCRVHVCVNIGTAAGKSADAPHIGDRVYIAPGAKIFGKITIADDIVIGANAVVNKSFDTPGISIAGIPARQISGKSSAGLLIAPIQNGG